jgi:hypothetical protein
METVRIFNAEMYHRDDAIAVIPVDPSKIHVALDLTMKPLII